MIDATNIIHNPWINATKQHCTLTKQYVSDNDALCQQCEHHIVHMAEYLQKYKITALYHITHWKNVNNIVSDGILSRHRVLASEISHMPIANPEVVTRRHDKRIKGKPLDQFVPLFFSKKTPMQYSLLPHATDSPTMKYAAREIVYICVNPMILGNDGVYFTDGNAASNHTYRYYSLEDLRHLPWNVITSQYWDANVERRMKAAEVLVPDQVEPTWFLHVIVYDTRMQSRLQKTLQLSQLAIEVNPHEYYFQL